MMFEKEGQIVLALLQDDSGAFSNHLLEGPKDVKFAPYAFACFYPIRSIDYLFFRLGTEAVDPIAYAGLILDYEVSEKTQEKQREIVNIWETMSEAEQELAPKVFSGLLNNPFVPFTFLMFAKSHPGEKRIAAIYHPLEFPTTVCLNLLKECAMKRVAKGS